MHAFTWVTVGICWWALNNLTVNFGNDIFSFGYWCFTNYRNGLLKARHLNLLYKYLEIIIFEMCYMRYNLMYIQ